MYSSSVNNLPLRAMMRPANPDTVITPTLGRKPGGGSFRKSYVSDIIEGAKIRSHVVDLTAVVRIHRILVILTLSSLV